jgi:hypothetical protein
VLIGKISENGYLLPEEAGGPKTISRLLPRVSSRIKKTFLIREEAPDASRGAGGGREVVPRGIPPVRRAGGSPPPRYISSPLASKFPFYSAKIRKKRKGGEEGRRGSGEALLTRRFGDIFSF